MERYGIIDVGSNTMVLIVYEMEDGRPVPVDYLSTPVHLVDYIRDGHMREEGIEKAVRVLEMYRDRLASGQCTFASGFITEPWRGIDNAEDMIRAFSAVIPVSPLSGEEEASYDYYGSQLSWPDVKNGIAFDIGGGSTELVSFENSAIREAMSFHLGCVRLRHLPLDTEECAKEIMKARQEYPSLNRQADTLIAIGGTVRAARLLCDDLYHTGFVIPADTLRDLYDRLIREEETAVSAMHRIVDPGRIPVFLPGMHMMLEIIRIFEAEQLFVSDTGIREGYLLKHCLKA